MYIERALIWLITLAICVMLIYAAFWVSGCFASHFLRLTKRC
jgi:hypothetical protein